MPPASILVVGSVNMDMVMRVQRLPRPGETLMANGFMTAHGGKGANQAVAAARLGARVSFAGAVGDDAFGALQREGLAREGIHLDHLRTDPSLPTGVAQILAAESGENMIVLAPGANHGLWAKDVEALRSIIASVDAVITQLEIPVETVAAVLQIARECGTFSVLDVGSTVAVPESLIAAADLVSPNETEAESLTGITVDSIESAREAALRLREMGARHVVMKLGAQGCFYTGEEEILVPAFAIDAVDTTASGDAFTAALVLAWGKASAVNALRFANAAGALAATVPGAQPSMPTLESVRAFLLARDCAEAASIGG